MIVMVTKEKLVVFIVTLRLITRPETPLTSRYDNILNVADPERLT